MNFCWMAAISLIPIHSLIPLHLRQDGPRFIQILLSSILLLSTGYPLRFSSKRSASLVCLNWLTHVQFSASQWITSIHSPIRIPPCIRPCIPPCVPPCIPPCILLCILKFFQRKVLSYLLSFNWFLCPSPLSRWSSVNHTFQLVSISRPFNVVDNGCFPNIPLTLLRLSTTASLSL